MISEKAAYTIPKKQPSNTRVRRFGGKWRCRRNAGPPATAEAKPIRIREAQGNNQRRWRCAAKATSPVRTALAVSRAIPQQIAGLFHAGSVGIIMSGWLGAVNYGVIVANDVDAMLMKT